MPKTHYKTSITQILDRRKERRHNGRSLSRKMTCYDSSKLRFFDGRWVLSDCNKI